ncbi:MAG TPA: DNA replication/repair protein RecF [Thermomicrobiales bacterium]|nr:DNA replication/repair protein RecF [Thermomicrobiales bacterium]
MHLTLLTLEEFRTYQQLALELPPEGLRIAGRNASGKTSLLEAIVLLATTRSPRTSTERDTVRWESGEEYGVNPYARLGAVVVAKDRRHRLEISLELPEGTARIARKRFRVDGRSVRAHDMVGVLRTVLFSPEDVQLVTGAPAERRRQMDILISQIDRSYMRALSRYGKVLSQRNGLLRTFSRDRVDPGSRAAVAQLSFWDEELVSSGSEIVSGRVVALADLTSLVAERSRFLISDHEIGINYHPRLDLPSWSREEHGSLGELQQRVQAAFLSQLEQVRSEEFRRGTTVVGPHRDDFLMTLDGRPLDAFGSRGQQRLGVVALKLSESDMITNRTGERPIVLLDDVLSELDEVHRGLLLDALSAENCQVLVTSADRSPLEHPALEHLPMVQLSGGKLIGNQAPA